MKLRVVEICKSKGMTQKELADKLEISEVGLSQQINGNPTIKTLEKIALILEMPVWQLFSGSENALSGIVEYQGVIHRIQSKTDLEKLLNLIND